MSHRQYTITMAVWSLEDENHCYEDEEYCLLSQYQSKDFSALQKLVEEGMQTVDRLIPHRCAWGLRYQDDNPPKPEYKYPIEITV